MGTTILIILGAVIALVLLFFITYVKTSPNQALVISGWPRKQPKFLVGTGGIRIPILQKVNHLYLGQFSVDIKANSIPTADFINVDVDAIAKVRIDPNMLVVAAANFLESRPEQIATQIKESLEGNLREIVGTQELKALNIDRDGFSNQIQEKAAVDMKKLGLEILTCNIQTITDDKGLINDLGADNTYMIKKNAAINRANAERDMKIAEANAKKEANDAVVKSETEIAERNNELEIKKANLKSQSDRQKAVADAAYKIQQQEQQKDINTKTVEAEAATQIRGQELQKEINTRAVDAEIEKAKKEQELRQQEIDIQQKKLEAEVNKTADAEKYKKEISAQAELEQRKRNAEAETYEAEMKAKAIKAKAEAELFAAQQEAEAIRAKGNAEAAAIKAKGEAEATAMDKKAEAYKKYNGAAMAEMMIKVLPSVAAEVAKPLSSISDVHVYGSTGVEAAGMTQNVPVVMRQIMETMKDCTGVDMPRMMQENSNFIAANGQIDKK